MENMYRQLNDELLRMQQQLNDLQGGSPARRVHIIRETTVDDSPNKVRREGCGSQWLGLT